MEREHRLARLFRALSGKTQDEAAKDLGVDRSFIALVELGERMPRQEHLEGLARGADHTVAEGEELLRLSDTLRRSRRPGPSSESRLHETADRLRDHVARAYRHLRLLALSDWEPGPEDRQRARELLERLRPLPATFRSRVVEVADQYQSWALCEAVCEESVRQASRDLERAAAWARLAREIAERVRGPEAWRKRLLGYAMAFEANVLRVQGELEAADTLLAEARQLWLAGSDPQGVLDRGRILDLEASLRRDQRRFAEALDRLAEELAVGRARGRALINKGFTLEVMGDYERAIDTLLEAIPLVHHQEEPRLWNIGRLNLANLLCHVGRYGEATSLVEEVRPLAFELGDVIDVIRIVWLQGRIAAGLGRAAEARRLLAEARRQFAAQKMSYDVALALLEEAVLLLDEGRTAEVQALARELKEVFKAKGVEREALAALRLFHEAVEREEATAELARRVLRYLLRARYDQDLPFNAS